MERKTVHRILGILVIVALAIILLPFFEASTDPAAEAMSVKAPPFPDQSVQVTSSTTVNQTQQHVPIKMPQSDNAVRLQPDDVISVVHPGIVNAQTPTTSASDKLNNDKQGISEEEAAQRIANSNEDALKSATYDEGKVPSDDEATQKTENVAAQGQDSAQISEDAVSVDEAAVAAKTVDALTTNALSNQGATEPAVKVKKLQHKTKQTESVKDHLVLNKHKTIENNGLFKLKSSVWVIQLGSFKNKANALRMVNQLRANGYRAFIQQMASNTRVFVGPENQQNSARDLANQLESELHLKGIVISYKPLSL